MIHVVYDRRRCRIEVSGHADSGPFGQDVLCGMVSILTYTAAQMVADENEAGHLLNATIDVDNPGYAYIGCRPLFWRKPDIRRKLDTVVTGLEILAYNYPGKVGINYRKLVARPQKK